MHFLLGQNRPKIPIFSTFINNQILRNFKGKNHGLVHEILEESLYLSKALLLWYNIWKIQLGKLKSNPPREVNAHIIRCFCTKCTLMKSLRNRMLIDMLYCSQGKLSLNEMKDPSITRENDSDAGKVGIQNPELWNPEYSLRNPESPLTIRIRNPFPLTKIRNPVPGIRIQRPGIQSPRLLIKKRKLSLWWSFRWSLWCWSVFWPDGLKRWREHAAYCQPNFPGVHP